MVTKRCILIRKGEIRWLPKGDGSANVVLLILSLESLRNPTLNIAGHSRPSVAICNRSLLTRQLNKPKSLQSAGTRRVLSVPLELWQPKSQDRTAFADTLRPVEVLPVERSHLPYILM